METTRSPALRALLCLCLLLGSPSSSCCCFCCCAFSSLGRSQKGIRRERLGARRRSHRHHRRAPADDEAERPRLVGDGQQVLGAALELDGLVEDEVEELVVSLQDALDCFFFVVVVVDVVFLCVQGGKREREENNEKKHDENEEKRRDRDEVGDVEKTSSFAVDRRRASATKQKK